MNTKSKIAVTLVATIVLGTLLAIGFRAISAWAFINGVDKNVDPAILPFVLQAQSELSPVRPARPNYVNLEDIHEGDFLYLIHGKVDITTFILIVKPPYMDGEYCRINYVWWKNGSPDGNFIWNSYCNDMGLVEYTGPFYGWNKYNYLKRSGMPSLTHGEVQEAIKGMRPEPPLNLHPEKPYDGKNL